MGEVSFQLIVAPDLDLFDEVDFEALPDSLLDYIVQLPGCQAFGDRGQNRALTPEAFRRMRLACVGTAKLEGYGFDWYTALHADRSMWRSTIINFVHFDCVAAEATIMFVDGSELVIDMLEEEDLTGDTLQAALNDWFRYVIVCYDFFCSLAPTGETVPNLIADLLVYPMDAITADTGLEKQDIDVEHHLRNSTFTAKHLIDGIEWLQRITRSELINIFARFINPVLRDNLPNTYPQWCAESELESLRSQARKASGELASLLRTRFTYLTDECQTWIALALHRDHLHQSFEDKSLEEVTFGILTTDDSGIIALGSTIVEADLQEDDGPPSPEWEMHSSDDTLSSDSDRFGPSENDFRAACPSPPSSSGRSQTQSSDVEEDYSLAFMPPQTLANNLRNLFPSNNRKRIAELEQHIAELVDQIALTKMLSAKLDKADEQATLRELTSLRQIDDDTTVRKRPKGAKAKAKIRAQVNTTVSPVNRRLRIKRDRADTTSARIAQQLIPPRLRADYAADPPTEEEEDAPAEPDIIVRPDPVQTVAAILSGLQREASVVYDDSGVGMMLDLPSSFSAVDARLQEDDAMSEDDEGETWFQDYAKTMLAEQGQSFEGDDGDIEMVEAWDELYQSMV